MMASPEKTIGYLWTWCGKKRLGDQGYVLRHLCQSSLVQRSFLLFWKNAHTYCKIPHFKTPITMYLYNFWKKKSNQFFRFLFHKCENWGPNNEHCSICWVFTCCMSYKVLTSIWKDNFLWKERKSMMSCSPPWN